MSTNLNQRAARAGLLYTLANILLKGIYFFSLPIFTDLLSTNDFGIYNTYIAYEQILTAIIGLGMYGTVKNAKIDFKEKFDEYILSISELIIIMFLICIFLVNFFSSLLVKFTGFDQIILNVLIIQSLGSALLYIYGIKLNVEFKYKSYIAFAVFNTVLNILISIVLILFVFPNIRYYGRILGSAIPLFIITISIIFLILNKAKYRFTKKYWKYACLIGLPLIPHVISQTLLAQVDRIMINNYVGSAESGIYSYIYTIGTILTIIINSADNAWTPWLFIKISENKKDEIKKYSYKYIALFSILTIGFMCTVPEVVKIMANNSYWSGIDLIIPITIANYFIFLYMLPVNIEYYNKKTSFISIGTISATIVNLILNYFGIKMFGYETAAYTTLISYILLFIFHWKIAKKYNVDEIYDYKYILKNILIVVISGILILIIKNDFLNLVFRYLYDLVLIIILIKNKNILINFIKKRKDN